jgi:predicted  nucleic acid-binding Zn-ribbon protein
LGVVLLCVLLICLSGVLAYIVREQKNALTDARSQQDQAQTEAARAKAESSRMTATAAELRLQLDRAGSAPAATAAPNPNPALQIRLRAAESRISDLQIQLNQARAAVPARPVQDASGPAPAGSDQPARLAAAEARLTELQAQLSQARADHTAPSADLQSQLDQANRRVALLQQSLAGARSQAQSAQAQLAQAQASLAKYQAPPAPAHPLPVAASFKKSGDRIVVWVKNRGSSPLSLTVTASGAGTELNRTATLKPGKTFEAGKVAPQSTVAITSDGYDAFRLVVH